MNDDDHKTTTGKHAIFGVDEDFAIPADANPTGEQPLFDIGDGFAIPGDAPTLFGCPPKRLFPYTIVDGRIVLRIYWYRDDPCDVEREKRLFDSVEEASAFVAGIDNATLAAKRAVDYHIVEPHAERKYFEIIDDAREGDAQM